MNISDIFQPFMDYCRLERQVAGSTLAKYKDCYQSWILPRLGSNDVDSLSRLDVLELRQAMVDKHLSIARQYGVIMFLKSLLKFCRNTLKLSCLDPKEVNLPRRGTPHVEYLSNEEIQKVLESINTVSLTGLRLRVLIELLLSTGMRISEALSLKRQVFEQDRSEVEIVGKGKRKRHVFFSPRCKLWVREYLDRRIDGDPALFVTTGFPVRNLKREDISRFFILLKRKAGLTKKFTPHVMRHTFCTNLRNHGADISHIRDLAGHEDIQTTARYYLGKDNQVFAKWSIITWITAATA